MTKLEELIQKLCPNGVEHKPLNEVSEMKRGTSITKKDIVEGEIPVVSGGREPALWCSTRFRQRKRGLYAVNIAHHRGVCQGKTVLNILRYKMGCGILIMVYSEILESRNPFYAAKP